MLGFNYVGVGAQNMDADSQNPANSNMRRCQTAVIDVGIVRRLPIRSRLALTTSKALRKNR